MDWSSLRHDSAHYIQGTKGARASEYFSMAKILPDPRQRSHYLKLAEDDIETALQSIQDEPSGYLAIRGHIRLMQGSAALALTDFEEVRRLKRTAGDDKGVAEALADIGLARIRMGDPVSAVKFLRDGIAGLEAAGSSTFAVRAKKRLAQALLWSGHPILALRELSVAHETALQNQIYDQVTPATAASHKIAMALGILKSGASCDD